MKRSIFLLLLVYPLLLMASGDTLRILCIGNSFSMDAVEQELLPLAQAEGVTLMVGDLYIGGCSLERHVNSIRQHIPDYTYNELRNGRHEAYEHVTSNEALRKYDWDIVTMQQASHYSGMWETYEPWLGVLIDSVKAICPKAKIAWHMTWAYSKDSNHGGFKNYNCDQQEMYARICACADKVMEKYPFDIFIPVGHAVQKARGTKLGDTFCRDGFHLSFEYGRYLAACVWLQTLTGKKPHAGKNCIIPYYGNYWELRAVNSRDIRSKKTERICRRVARKTVKMMAQ